MIWEGSLQSKYIDSDGNEAILNIQAGKVTANTSSTVDPYSHLITIYPNPASQFIHIESETEISKIEILDSKGRACAIRFNLNMIDVSDLAPGSYMLKMYHSKGISSKKMLILR